MSVGKPGPQYPAQPPQSGGVPEGKVGPSKAFSDGVHRAKNDRLQWVPNYNATMPKAHTQIHRMEWNGLVADNNPNSEFRVTPKGNEVVVRDDLGRIQKWKQVNGGWMLVWERQTFGV